MPLTVVHPLMVMPFRRVGIFSALVVGSMAPDFRRLALPLNEAPEHTWTAAVDYYLPSALIALFLFHRLIKLPMISLAPRQNQSWLLVESPAFAFCPFARFVAIVLATFTGIATHLVWDSFTHPGGWGLRQLGWESRRIQFTPHYGLSMAHVLWDLSTLGGLLLMFFLLARAFARNSVSAEKEAAVTPMKVLGAGRTALIVAGFALALLPGMVMLARDPQYWLHDERRKLGAFFAVSGLDVVLLEIVVYSVLWQVRNGKRSQDTGEVGTSAVR